MVSGRVGDRGGWLVRVCVLAVAVLVLRLAGQLLWGVELAADEAQYWDWSEHPALSYYSKGPGVAWVIWLSTAVLGDAEWAVRLPSAIAHALLVLLVGGFAWRVSGGGTRGVWCAGVAACVTPALLVAGSFMTIDMPLIACWAGAAWLGWEVMEREHRGRRARGLSAALGLVIGVGFLFKYTMLLIVPGLVLAAVLRARPRWGRATTEHALIAGGVCAVAALPVLIWNAQHGWPTVAHLLGHLRLPGGDMPVVDEDGGGWTVWWMVEFVLGQLGVAGPMLLLMVLASWRSVRWRIAGEGDVDERGRWGDLYCVSVGAPIFAVYFVVSLFSSTQANWPIAGYATLCIVAGRMVGEELERYRVLVARWRADAARPKMGFLRRKPETVVQVLWHWSIGYGTAAGVGVVLLGVVGDLPVVREVLPLHRVSGARERAEAMGRVILEMEGGDASGVLVLGSRYTDTALMSYYLGRFFGEGESPTVGSGAWYLGERESGYDYWEATDPAREEWMGGRVYLSGVRPERWMGAFVFERVETVDEGHRLRVGHGYGGPREGGAER